MKRKNNLLYDNFQKSLTEDQKKEFRLNVNHQKDWYINWLENHIFELDALSSPNAMGEELRKRGYAVAIWGVEDVQSVIDNYFSNDERLKDNPLTEEDMKIILKSVDDNHDANFGITREYIREAVFIYIGENRFLPYDAEEKICRNCKHLGFIDRLNAHTCNLSTRTFHTVEKTPGMAGYTTGTTVPLTHSCDKFETNQ